MANPITWRNVSSRGGGAGSAASLLSGAQRSLQAGFGSIGEVLERESETQKANWGVRRDNNTQDFLNQLSQFRTPAEFQAAQQSGALQQAMGQYGRQIDQEAARTALDERLGVLQQRNTATQQYDDNQTQRANRGLRGQITDMVLDGNTRGAQDLFDQNSDSFVNASAVRRELFGDMTSRNNENRAQAGERRSQGRYGMAQEVQGWRREDRALATKEREDDDWLSSRLNQAYDARVSGEASDLSYEQQDAVLHRELRDKGYSVGEADKALSTLESSLQNRITPSSFTNAEDQRQDAIARSEFQIDGNPFAGPARSPTEAVTNVVDKYTDGDGFLFGEDNDSAQRKTVMNSLLKLASDGITVSKGDTTRKIPVPEEVLDMAMQGTKDGGWFDSYDDLETTVRDLYENQGLMELYDKNEAYKSWRSDYRAGRASQLPNGPGRLTYYDLTNPQ